MGVPMGRQVVLIILQAFNKNMFHPEQFHKKDRVFCFEGYYLRK